MAFDEGLAERVREVMSAREGVVERKMFGGIGWMLGGNMACGVMSTGGLLVRLAADEAEAVWATVPEASPFGREGAKPMKGFVIISEDAIAEDADLARWVDAGASHAASLPPK